MSYHLLFSNILLITSDQDLARGVRVVLQNAGYTARVMSTGAAALKAIAAAPPDLILLDAALPDMDAYTLLRELRARAAEAQTAFLPIIVLSAAAETDTAAALNAGADEVLHPPLSHAELLLRVRSMLRLKAITDELRDVNATLEQKVVERTQALEAAHAALRHSEKLTSLGRLAASVAHEINNPLTGILSYIYLMKYEIPAGSGMLKDLGLIERQVNAIAALVKQLQSFAKPPRAERRPALLADIVADVLALVEKELQRHNIEVTYTCDAELRPVWAAPDQLAEVFMNLVINARDAMPAGGQLAVSLANDGDHVVARITDTGAGMPPDVLERIFEPFFTTKGEQGTGLGLAICYRIIQEHAGELRVESAPGAGAMFTIRLPQLKEG